MDGSNNPRSEVIPQSYGYANLFLFPLWKVSFFYLFSFWCGCRHVQMCGVTLTLITFSPFPLLIFISAHSLSPSSSHALALALTALMHAHARTHALSRYSPFPSHYRPLYFYFYVLDQCCKKRPGCSNRWNEAIPFPGQTETGAGARFLAPERIPSSPSFI